MLTSAAEVFRKRQSIGDLTRFIGSHPLPVFERLAVTPTPASAEICRQIRQAAVAGQLVTPRSLSDRLQEEILLAAAMPEEDYQGFLLATSLLLLDLLAGHDDADNLYWNWEAFHQHLQLADPSARAVVNNGFRAAEDAGVVTLDPPQSPGACLSATRAQVIAELSGAGQRQLQELVGDEASASECGESWAADAGKPLHGSAVAAYRYLAERPVGMAPPDPLGVELVPWRG